MKRISRTAAVAACLAVAAVPAIAAADKPQDPASQGHRQGQTKANGQGHSKRCKKPTVSKGWVVKGTYTSWTGTQDNASDPKTTYSGTLTMTVTHTNHHAKGATSPFTFSHAKVKFDSPTATGPVTGDNAKLIGKIVVARKGCATQAAAATPSVGTVTIKKIVFSTPSP